MNHYFNKGHFSFSCLLLVFSLLLFQDGILMAQENKTNGLDTTYCLKVLGIAIEKKVPIDGALIALYKENEQLQWEEITSIDFHEHHFIFNLLGNSYYTIEVSKPGYVTRSIGISTVLPEDIKLSKVKYTFEFEVELFKTKEGSDDYYLDFPIALVAYNPKTKAFEYNAKYTNHIKTRIKQSTVKKPENETAPH